MASRLSNNHKLLLTDTLFNKRVGTRPYENGIWGTQSDRDFAFVEILDQNNNIIEAKNVSFDEFTTEDGYIKFYPGSHIRSFGYQSGVFNIRYNFLREMAGNNSTVLVHTMDKEATKVGDIYPNTNNIYITDEGIVYLGSEENYLNNPSTTEQLKLEDLKYIIDEVSSDRTEVRIKTKKINGSYMDEFVNIQTPIRIDKIEEQNISFISQNNEALFDSTTLQLSTPSNFEFKLSMREGTISIPEVFKVDEIQTAARTNLNALVNPNGEFLETDNQGNVVTLGNAHGWDASLHNMAVSVDGWSSGYLNFGNNNDTFFGTSAIGYHAHWVQNEGVVGGVCMKFQDTNELFTALDEWPNESPYRQLRISQQMPSLQGQGITNNDLINIRCDIRSTVVDKGVQMSIHYADEFLTEDMPTQQPEGYFDPFAPGPSETQPNNDPPGYAPNNETEANLVEPKPSHSQIELRTQYEMLNSLPPGHHNQNAWPVVGQTTAIWGGADAWIILGVGNTDDDSDFILWGPNLSEDLMVGAQSVEGQWVWSGYQWNPHPTYLNIPTPPEFTVNNESAVNHHPYQLTDAPFYARYRRNTSRGLQTGWQTGTIAYNYFMNGIHFNTKHDPFMEKKAFLFKDDLVWCCKINATEYGELRVYTIEDWFQNNLLRTIEVIGQDGKTRTLFDDIFEFGFIQSVTRVKEPGSGGSNEKMRSNSFIIFYNDGRGDVDTSNKWFQFDRETDGTLIFDGEETTDISYLKDISSLLNTEVNDNNLKFEVSFWQHRNDNQFRYRWLVGSRVHESRDGNGDITNDSFENDTNNYPANITDRFGHFDQNIVPDVLFPMDARVGSEEINHHMAIIGNDVFKAEGKDMNEREWTKTIDEVFYGAGEVGNKGIPLTYGSRNPAATNFGVHDEDGNVVTFLEPLSELENVVVHGIPATEPVYDNGNSIFDFVTNPNKDGTLSELGLWKWNGPAAVWESNLMTPAPLSFKTTNTIDNVITPGEVGKWEKHEISIPVPFDMMLDKPWHLYISGDGVSSFNQTQGVVWVDNLFVDFTLKGQSVTQEVRRPYTAQILEVLNNGNIIRVDKSFKQRAMDLGVEDSDPSTDTVYDVELPETYNKFNVSYTNQNPFDLRTYLKFDNNLFLTTNFKQDKINVLDYPHSVVYKLYEPLSDNFQKFDECTIVKEMANPLTETVNIVDFVPAEEGKLVLRSADLQNVESTLRLRQTDYKTETDILTEDETISEELRNEFLSQSLDSVEINTDYSRYENFINFSSVEKRVRNFKDKLENIESYIQSSASFVGVSGSVDDLSLYHHKILDTKNKFDDFESYMYFESSSYVSSSLGIFYDNAWPKASGVGTLNSPYVVAHTTSSQASTWFDNIMVSSSAYDEDNNSKLSTLIPEFIKFDNNNKDYLTFTDMIGQHFDHIWEYINALSDTFDRRDKLDEGMSKELLYSVGKSLGWNLNDGKDLIDLPRYALGKEVTGSAYSDYSATSERDISREIWSRIINNMPFFLKNKGTVRALKGLINIYGIPSTILRVKEYGGPDLPDDASPQYEITRKFTKALDFRSSQYIKTAWANDTTSGRKPDSIEVRFKTTSGSNQVLARKVDGNDQDWIISLKKRDTQTDYFTGAVNDNYGYVSFRLSGSKVGIDQGDYKEITSSALPVYDGDFYSVMVRRTSGSSNVNVSQSYELHVGKYDSGRSKIHLYSTSSMDVSQAPSASFSNAWTGSGTVYIGGSGSMTDIGGQFSGSMMEYRHWTETLNTSSFKNHIANPKAYDGNSVSSSYENLVLRYSMNDNKNLSSDTDGIRDVSSNQTTTLSGSHLGFTGNFFSNVVDELKTHIPSIGALRRSTNKIRIESNPLKDGYQLRVGERSTKSAYDTAPNDSNKVGIWFAPTDVINNDIINSVGDLNFDNYLGDPRDKKELSYRGLNYTADNYWKKYTAPNNFWDYMRLIKYYDQSMYTQLRKMIPARAKPDIGLLVEPNIFERPKVINTRDPQYENTYYSSSIDIIKEEIVVTSSYNAGVSISDYNSYTGRRAVFTYDTGSVLVVTGSNLCYYATGSEIRDRFLDRGIFQTLEQPGDYSNVTMSGQFGDTISGSREVLQPIITGSRKYSRNQKTMNFYTSSDDAVSFNANSSSYYFVDLDNLSDYTQARYNSFYKGVKNTQKTTADGKVPIEVIISAPTKLVTTDEGVSPLTTGEGMVSDFKDPPKLPQELPKEGEPKQGGPKTETVTDGGLAGSVPKILTDTEKDQIAQQQQFDKDKQAGKLGTTDMSGNSNKNK